MHYLGIDFGTSGARGMLLEQAGIVKAEVRVSFSQAKSQNLASLWQKTLEKLLYQIPSQLRKKTKRIAINGTSATVILCDKQGNPLDEPILYNDNRGIEILADLQTIVPANSVALSATSSLAKLVWWERKGITQPASYFLHQADWLAFLLHGKLGISDYHNALKLGYDVENLTYPNWLENLAIRRILPEIVEPGSPIATIKPEIRHQFAFPADCLVCAGTTDSIAAFIASGAKLPGEAVTSLGSTLVLKLLSQKKIEDVTAGIYSHRLGDLWLTGGASNTGGAVLQHFFSDQQLIELSRQINPAIPTKLDYYPLLTPGERFPWNDPHLKPIIYPIPSNRAEFLHGLLEGIAKIEALGYQRLQNLGASKLSKVYTAGGGAKNEVWRQIRENYLKIPVLVSVQSEAAYGTALLSKSGLK